MKKRRPKKVDALARARSLYLELLKATLIGKTIEDPAILQRDEDGLRFGLFEYDKKLRDNGQDLPTRALSMIGQRRMDQLQDAIEAVIADDVPGDLIETGVWRGGATILMRGVLAAHGVRDRRVYAADSFAGMPAPNPELYPADRNLDFRGIPMIEVSVDVVKASFRRYGLLDKQVHFLVGWFKDTLPKAPIKKLAVLRLDGDLYESTIDALTHLYPKLSPGGFTIVDDYHIPACRAAVEDYRKAHRIRARMIPIDADSVYWRRA